MKKLVIILFTFFLAQLAFAQTKTTATITPAFIDSLKQQIVRISPLNNSISKLVYQSTISAKGKLTKPLIWRQTGGGTAEENEFVVNLRTLIMAAPPWKPAVDNKANKAIEDNVEFTVELSNGEIKISQSY